MEELLLWGYYKQKPPFPPLVDFHFLTELVNLYKIVLPKPAKRTSKGSKNAGEI